VRPCLAEDLPLSITMSKGCPSEKKWAEEREGKQLANNGIASYAALGHVPLDFQESIFQFTLEMTATLCGCLSNIFVDCRPIVCILRAGVQPTLDPYAEAFL